jgi:transposase
MRYELSDYEWTAIKPMLPSNSRGVPRVNDRRVPMASFGSRVQVRHGATYRRPMVPAPTVTIASFGGRVASQDDVARGSRLRRGLDQGACSPTRSSGQHSKRNRKDPICFSPYLHRARNLIERFFNKTKQMSAGRDPI